MNLIGLDISKVSTAMVIETNNKEYLFSYNTKSPTYKWNKLIQDLVNIKTYTYIKEEEYSKSEISKLTQFVNISNDIISDILSTIDIKQETTIYIEGYSYGRDPGPIIDLVGIGSIVRGKILENIPYIKEIKIVSPKKLKVLSCELCYGSKMVQKGVRKIKIEKVINTNNNGKKGGDFDKHDMCQAILDSEREYILGDFLRENYDEVIGMKSFPKPLEDLDDAWWAKECINPQIES